MILQLVAKLSEDYVVLPSHSFTVTPSHLN